MNVAKGLSKSRLLSFRQCKKKLYLETFRKDLIEITTEQQKIFNTGHEVGELAQTFYPNGILIGNDFELNKAIEETNTHLANPDIETLFEATFEYQGVLVRTDLLHKSNKGFLIQEVKSSTSVKDIYIEDCAIQKWVIEGVGYTVHDVQLSHINNQFIYEKLGNYEGIFLHPSLTSKIEDIQSYIGGWVDEAFKVIESKTEPEILPGEQCNTPYLCPFIDYCDPVTTDFPVENLPNGTRTAIALRNEGIVDIRDIPVDRLSSENQERVRRVTVSRAYELEAAARLEMLDLSYPRYYIDFESINYAIPRWLGVRPYQQICFQWSCHIEHSFDEITHVEFLDTTGDDPSYAFIQSLIEAVGEEGAILVYHAGFENTRLKELAKRFPEYKDAITNILARVVDLLPIARKFYYHPDMKGSWSIKNVLPTIAPELNYKDLEEVQNGGGAQDAYIEATNPNTTLERNNILEKNLIEYCKLDTWAMVKIAHFFELEGH